MSFPSGKASFRNAGRRLVDCACGDEVLQRLASLPGPAAAPPAHDGSQAAAARPRGKIRESVVDIRIIQRSVWAAACVAGIVTFNPASAQVRSVRPAVQPSAPAAAAAIGAPSPSGLQSRFPSGLPAPTPPVVSTTPAQAAAAAATAAESAAADAAATSTGANDTRAAGAAPAPTPGRAVALANPGPYSAVDIAASFLRADLNHDGELTRAEYDRLSIAPWNFDDADRNHDGVVTRFEYQDSLQ